MNFLPPARAVFLTGFMGTGKTTTGRRLAENLGLEFCDTDDIVQELAGRTIPDVFEDDGEQAFRGLETRALKEAIQGPPAVVATGGGIITRQGNVDLMRAAGPIICLEASPITIHNRTRHRDDRPLLQCPDPLGRIEELLQERADDYAQADYTIRTDSRQRQEVLERLERVLRQDARTAILSSDATRLNVRPENGHYKIHIETNALKKLYRLCRAPSEGLQCAIVTTDVIGPIYGERVVSALERGGWDTEFISVPDGEGSKTPDTARKLYDRLIDAGMDSGATVFALGGGVVGDLAGFVAATYRRGIGFCQLPTSLLAQVDASSGGKVAVNHERGKNLIGAFYQPSGVVIDPVTLETLPKRELRSGMAEVIKHGVIADSALFEYLEGRLDEFISLEELAVRYVLARNCQIKAKVVEQDPFDRGLRGILNYGHTIGHALERAAEHWDLAHGEAVAVGMVAEARMAHSLGLCNRDCVDRQVNLLAEAGLPVYLEDLDMDAAINALKMDKKIRAGCLRMPLLREIGEVQMHDDVDGEAVEEALRTVTRSA